MDKCKICGTEFKRHYHRKGQRKIYCSKKCRYQDTPVYERICKTCGKKFQAIHLKKNKEFCSIACIQRYPCKVCGKIITGRVKFQSNKRFCSRSCASFFNQTLKAKISYVSYGFAKTIKNIGKICCEKCGIDDVEMLIVHHLDKNRKNNNLNNLITLCANCHHKAHWGKGRNRKKNIDLAFLIAKNDAFFEGHYQSPNL